MARKLKQKEYLSAAGSQNFLDRVRTGIHSYDDAKSYAQTINTQPGQPSKGLTLQALIACLLRFTNQFLYMLKLFLHPIFPQEEKPHFLFSFSVPFIHYCWLNSILSLCQLFSEALISWVYCPLQDIFVSSPSLKLS